MTRDSAEARILLRRAQGALEVFAEDYPAAAKLAKEIHEYLERPQLGHKNYGPSGQ